jgi:hypothetical protein
VTPSPPLSAVAQRRCSSLRCDRRAAQLAEACAALKARDEIFPKADRSSQYGAEPFLDLCHHMEKQMTKVTFVSAALIAAAVFTTQAMRAGAVNSPAWHEAVSDVGRTH